MTAAAELTAFVETLAVYFEIAKKRHGAAWLCSLRSAMRMDRSEFERLAFAAHQADLIVLSRADLTGFECNSEMDARYLTESALKVGGGLCEFHFLSSYVG